MRHFFIKLLLLLLLAPPICSARLPTESLQLIVVTAESWDTSQGLLSFYERSSDTAAWVAYETAIPVVLGKTGMAWGVGLHSPTFNDDFLCKAEGDNRSPAGIFSLGTAFGLKPAECMSDLKIDYLQLDDSTEAVDDPASVYYNCIVSRKNIAVPDWDSSERMGQEPLYDVGLVINHNFPNPTAGAGSAIFMHIWRASYSGTAGCTAMSKESLLRLLYWLDCSKNPTLVQLPEDLYMQLEKKWGLPHAPSSTDTMFRPFGPKLVI